MYFYCIKNMILKINTVNNFKKIKTYLINFGYDYTQ